ncbi:MAG: hypothetical protein JWO38_5475 [Gemmataceae bacterium]|nr:hypothetical protein [Gemmataceae bacterium]
MAKQEAARLKKHIEANRDEEIGRIREEFAAKWGPPRSAGKGGELDTRVSKARQKAEAEHNQRIAEGEKQAAEDLAAIDATVVELAKLYANPAELAKHARVVDGTEIEENEFNLNIPRYVDTFEPEEPIDVAEALRELDDAEKARQKAEKTLRELLRGVGYGT